MPSQETRLQVRTKALLLCVVLTGWFLAGTSRTHAQTLAEALDTTNLVWTTGGDTPWFGQTTNTYDGMDAATCEIVDSNQTSWIETTVIGPAAFSYRTLRSNRPGMLFTINGKPPTSQGIQIISVDRNEIWPKATVDLYEGSNVLRWSVPDNTGLGWSHTGSIIFDDVSIGLPRALSFEYEPQDVAVYPQASALLVAQAVGTPPIQYQWRKDGQDLAGATNNFIDFAEITTNEAGSYSVVVSNANEFASSSNVWVTVLPPTAPGFTQEPSSLTAYNGEIVNLGGSVTGAPPMTFIWYKDGVAVQTNQDQTASAQTYAVLTLTNITAADAGSYTLVATNDLGGVESSNVVLTVLPAVAPTFIRQPRSLEIAAGVSTWLEAEATGLRAPDYEWRQVGVAPPDPPYPLPLRPTFPVIQFKYFYHCTTNDAGIYYVTAKNSGGETNSREALVTVLPPLTKIGAEAHGAVGLFVTNGLAFLARDTNGLSLVCVTNPAAPQWLGDFTAAGPVKRVYAAAGLAYLAEGAAGLQIVAVTNPANPVLVGSYPADGFVADVVVRSNLAYVADSATGMRILDVSHPEAPALVGRYSTTWEPRQISLAGNLACLASLTPTSSSNLFAGAILLVDISSPAHPKETGRFYVSFDVFEKAVVSGEYIYAAGPTGVSIFSVTNLALPMPVGYWDWYQPTNGLSHVQINVSDICVVNDLLYAIDHSGAETRLYVVDARDPSELVPVGYFTQPGRADALGVDGNQVYLAGVAMPLQVIQTPFNPQPTDPPVLTLTQPNGLMLQFHGRRGLHYDVEFSDALAGPLWQTLQTFLLTNETATIPVTNAPAARFFRLKQLD